MILLALVACVGSNPDTSQHGDSVPDTGNTDDTAGTIPDTCADVPVVVWENFGEGFMLGYCDSCHTTASPNRHDAPAEVNFDTEADVAAWKERILIRAASAESTMPPGGGVPATDRELLAIWLTCWL